jgi:phage terminase small subunit
MRRVEETFDLEEHQKRYLLFAAHALDRAANARAMIERDGEVIQLKASGLPRPNPAVAIERDAITTFHRMVKALGLDIDGRETLLPIPGARSHRLKVVS